MILTDLQSCILRHHDTQRQLASALGISPSTLSAKIHGKGTSFRLGEILLITERYHLSAEEVDTVFFAC